MLHLRDVELIKISELTFQKASACNNLLGLLNNPFASELDLSHAVNKDKWAIKLVKAIIVEHCDFKLPLGVSLKSHSVNGLVHILLLLLLSSHEHIVPDFVLPCRLHQLDDLGHKFLLPWIVFIKFFFFIFYHLKFTFLDSHAHYEISCALLRVIKIIKVKVVSKLR